MLPGGPLAGGRLRVVSVFCRRTGLKKLDLLALEEAMVEGRADNKEDHEEALYSIQ